MYKTGRGFLAETIAIYDINRQVEHHTLQRIDIGNATLPEQPKNPIRNTTDSNIEYG